MSVSDLQELTQSFAPALAGVLLRSPVLIVAGALSLVLLRSKTAELKHLVCHGILCGILLLPVVHWIAPPLRHPSVTFTRSQLAIFRSEPGTVKTRGEIPSGVTIVTPNPQAHPFRWTLLITVLYVSVACTLLIRLVLNVQHVNRVANSSDPIFDPEFRELAHEIWLESLSLYKPQIRVSKDIRVPMALGTEQPAILLPVSWRLWNSEKLRAALIHEMAHVRRNDPQTILLASFAVCLFWANPLVYWLRRKLAALAEEACDESVLLDFTAEEYARILIEFATEVGLAGTRLAVASTAAVQRSAIQARLEHIFSIPGYVKRNQPLLRVLLIGIFIPILYLAASTRFDQEPSENSADRASAIHIANQQQARQMEAELARDPDNLNLRGALMAFYYNERNDAALLLHELWVVHHHPEARINFIGIVPWRSLSSSHLLQNSPEADPGATNDYEVLKAAWEKALTQYPESPDVLYDAGIFFQRSDVERALDLLHRAVALTPADSPARPAYIDAMSIIYATAVKVDLNWPDQNARIVGMTMDLGLAHTLSNEIEASTDPELLSRVGTWLATLRHEQEGLSLIQRAIDLDPANPKWKGALESAKAEPIRGRMIAESVHESTDRGIRVGAAVAEANLVTKVDPKYPALALQARVSGTVEFTVRIDPNGKVQSLQLVRGHPLLVDAAKEAVMEWLYKPTMLNGQRVPVITTVEVPFVLPER